jgi:hypothetical protein
LMPSSSSSLDILGKVRNRTRVAFRANDQGPSKPPRPSFCVLLSPLTDEPFKRLPIGSSNSYTPSVRGSRFRISSPPSQTNDDALHLIAALSGHNDMNTGLIYAGWKIWAFFQVLFIDNVLSIVEVRSVSRRRRVGDS